jgi:phosphoribosylamine--glycine ligase
MNVLVVGAGAREAAIAWKLVLSPAVDTIYCAPGNGGTALVAQNLDMSIDTESECDHLASWAFNNKLDLVIIGPEAPLSHGMADTLMMFGVPVAGPTKAASRLEWSKAWARDFMARHDIPSPRYEVVQGMSAVREKLASPGTSYPLVVKADGLAGGKGAEVLRSPDDVDEALTRLSLTGALPPESEATNKVVIEEFLEGIEVSALAFVDGRNVAMMPPVCDYKRLLDDDQGPLTGGMGAYSPTRYVTPELWAQVESDIMAKAVQGMLADGTPYRGVLYAGLMLTRDGPKVLEFNCRLGDPEAQVLLPRLKTPLEDICMALAGGDLSRLGPIEWDDRAAVGVVLASSGYPTSSAVPTPVKGLAEIEEGVLVFHGAGYLLGATPLQPMEATATAGRKSVFKTLFGKSSDDLRVDLGPDILSPRVTATGGRLLTVVGLGKTLSEAREIAYRNTERVQVGSAQYRKDIAAREEE